MPSRRRGGPSILTSRKVWALTHTRNVRPFLSVTTLANLSDWPKEKIVTFRRLLRNEPLVLPHDLLAAQKSLPHGHVAAIREMIGRLRLRKRFGLRRVVMVGDRGMQTQQQIDKLKQHSGLGWITPLTTTAIRGLVEQGALQLSLLDQKNSGD